PPKSGRLPRNLSLTKKRNIWGIRRDMPKKEADLTALENEETAGAESRSAETAETLAAEAQGEETTAGRAEFEQLKAEHDQVKKERDALLDRLARLQAEFENARKRAEKE